MQILIFYISITAILDENNFEFNRNKVDCKLKQNRKLK